MLTTMSFCYTESIRIPCVEAATVQPLVGLMNSPQLSVITQACRALGNICFDNGKYLAGAILVWSYKCFMQLSM